MKAHLLLITLLLSATLAAEDLVTVGGKKYTGFTVTRVESKGITISHDDGLAKILFTDLPEAIRAKYEPVPQKVAPAQETSSTSKTFSEGKRPFDGELTEPEKFFESYLATGHPKPRDQFETQQEYEARLPKPGDSDRIYYFIADAQPSFSYDIDKQQLNLVSGEFKSPEYREYSLGSMVPFLFHAKYDRKAPYEASNAFGKTVTVEKTYVYDYLFHFSPKSFDRRLMTGTNTDKTRMAVAFHISRDEAKDAAPRLAIVCGVKFLDPKRSVSECTLSGKPTIKNPSEIAVFSNGIDAELISVHVLDKKTKEDLARYGAK